MMYSVSDMSRFSDVSIRYCLILDGTRSVSVHPVPVGLLGGRPARAFMR